MTGARASMGRADRALGDRLREKVRESPDGARRARLLADAMAPAFQIAVGAMLARRRTRGTGLLMLLGAGGASLIARGLRDGVGRPRPGPREEGGMPSRHAAGASAIATVVSRSRSPLALLAWPAVMLGGGARVASGDHEPGDVVAGGLLGAAVGWALTGVAGVLVGWRR